MQDGQQPNEPGWVFRPGDSSPDAAELPQAAPVQQPMAADPVPSSPSPAPAPSAPVSGAHIEWSASEYIADSKGAGWFTILTVGSVVLAIIVYVLSREIISTAAIVVVGILVGIFAARQPRTLQYAIDSAGIHVGEKFYPYAGFKAFSVSHEHAIGFISLLPLRRFMPPLIIHYAPEDEETIAEVLANYLPYEEHKPDMVDALTRKFRF